MGATGRPIVVPLFLDGQAGRVFAVHFTPETPAPERGGLIYVPPFAEEMNRSRRMAALQARALAALGVEVLLLDLHGTGDSDGDFADARWSTWLADIATAALWMEGRSKAPLGLWGLRLGALLAASAAATAPGRFSRLLLWQPVTDGKAMLTQFLRIRVAAAMAEGGRETMETLRAQLAQGRSIEVAGYELAAEMAEALGAARLEASVPDRRTRVDWLEVGASTAPAPGPAGERVAAAWRKAEVTVSTESVAGDPFWTLQEITVAPALIAATARRFETCPS